MMFVAVVTPVTVTTIIALRTPSRNGGTPHILPCVLPLSLRRTSLTTSELKVSKLPHLSGRPRSWTLYICHCLTPRPLFPGTLTSATTDPPGDIAKILSKVMSLDPTFWITILVSPLTAGFPLTMVTSVGYWKR
jgi:hypothetical protein